MFWIYQLKFPPDKNRNSLLTTDLHCTSAETIYEDLSRSENVALRSGKEISSGIFDNTAFSTMSWSQMVVMMTHHAASRDCFLSFVRFSSTHQKDRRLRNSPNRWHIHLDVISQGVVLWNTALLDPTTSTTYAWSVLLGLLRVSVQQGYHLVFHALWERIPLPPGRPVPTAALLHLLTRLDPWSAGLVRSGHLPHRQHHNAWLALWEPTRGVLELNVRTAARERIQVRLDR